MKKCIILVMLTMGMMNNVMGKEPVARITDGLVVIAPGKTNAVDTAWLNIGENKVVVTPNGNTKVGVGIVRDFYIPLKAVFLTHPLRFQRMTQGSSGLFIPLALLRMQGLAVSV